MEDNQIVELFWKRSESAISETAEKYGNYLSSIAYQILSNMQDTEECVNDTYNHAWNAMPPHRPSVLSSFLGKITRRISIDVWRRNNAEKRGNGEIVLALDELESCVSVQGSVEDDTERRELIRTLNQFLRSLPVMERKVFLCRYWYFEPVSAIAKRFHYSESKVTSMLYRIRVKLRRLLEKEGY